MPSTIGKGFLQSIIGKLLLAFIMGAAAITLSYIVTRVGFNEMLSTVQELSSPNEKLRLVNELFQELNLAQTQQLQTFKQPSEEEVAYNFKTEQLLHKLDSLQKKSRQNAGQMQQIETMRKLLHNRDSVFHAYSKLRKEFTKNEGLTNRIKKVSRLVTISKPLSVDSSVITSQQKITTTTTLPPIDSGRKKKKSFFGRLFGSKKSVIPLPEQKQVEQEMHVRIDTLSVSKQDSLLKQVDKVVRQIQRDQTSRLQQLMKREQDLIQASNHLHLQLVKILNSIEAEELKTVKQNSGVAMQVVNASFRRINIILLVFFLIMAIFLFLILVDITRSHRYREQLIVAKEDAEHLGHVKQRFLANMSHEIRTPLQSIVGFAEQMRSQKLGGQYQAVEAIYQSSEHLLQIVNEVLDYSRIISGKFTFEQKTFDVQKLVEDVFETMEIAADAKGIDLYLDTQQMESSLCVGDPFRLRQILFNLMGNAIKFTPEGSVTLTVRQEIEDQKAVYSFAVKDTGVGISAKDLKRVFNMFEQAETSHTAAQEGTGLGLSIVKALVDAQGGELLVSSLPQKGSEFTVKISYAQGSEEDLSDLFEETKVLPEFSAKFKGQVLVVDDDAFILQLCDIILSKHQIDHICTSNAEEVLAKEWSNNLKLVLLDIRMPVMNGLDLCARLRQKLDPSVPIFALTAQALPEERNAILSKGFDGILMKPFREQDLMALIQQKLNKIKSLTGNSPAPLSETNPLNLASLRKMVGNDEDLLQGILYQFVQDTNQDLSLLQVVIEEKDRAGAEEVLHRLSSRTGQVGASELSELLRQKERVFSQEEGLPQDWKELQELCHRVEALKKAISAKVLSSDSTLA